MTREPEIALVLSAEEWVDALHRHCADHGGARVRCLVLDPVVAHEEHYDVLVASERWPALTRPFVDGLHQRGRRVLVVGDPARGADLARRLGVDRIVGPSTTPSQVVEEVLALVPLRSSAGPPTGPSITDGPAAGTAGAGDAGGATGDGGFVVVGGPWGAGSTEVALALAGHAARRGERAVVVDADPVTPSLAVRLGLPLEPNLCNAVDAVAFGLGAVPGALFDLGDGWPVVLVGAPNRRAGAALAGADVVAVGEVLRQRFAPVVFDVSAGPAGRDAPSDDVRAAVLARAAVVIAVGAANPVGVVRLIEWVDAARGLAGGTPIHLVVNRAPSGRARRAELAGELQREARLAGLTFAPSDPRVEEAAWTASLVDRGPFARAVATLHRVLEGSGGDAP